MVFNATFNNILVISWRLFLFYWILDLTLRGPKAKLGKQRECNLSKANKIKCVLS
jgi:hypothetical protein